MVRMVRPVNLFIVGITQMIFWFFLVNPVFSLNGITPLMNTTIFTAMMVITLLVTAGGYVINDMLDIETDKVNKGGNSISKGDISPAAARKTYIVLNVLAFLLAGFVFYHTKKFNTLAYCAGCILILWLYSRYLKSTVLLGNVVVSLLIGFVPFMFVIIEDTALQALEAANPAMYKSMFSTIIPFTIFAFLANLVREIVKDCEDYEGDKSAGILTLSTALGYKKSDLFSQTLTITLLVAAIMWLLTKGLVSQLWELAAFLLLVMLPIVFLFFLLTKQDRNKLKYSSASKHTKLLMALGLLYLLFHLYKNYHA